MYDGIKILSEPYSRKEIRAMIKPEKGEFFIQGVVLIDFHDLLGTSQDDFNDMISTKLIGHPVYLEDIDYEVVGVEENEMLAIRVGGSVENWYNEDGI